MDKAIGRKIAAAVAFLAAMATLLLFVGVNPAEWLKHKPLNVSIVGVMNAKTLEVTVPYEINDTNADHNTGKYPPAEPGALVL